MGSLSGVSDPKRGHKLSQMRSQGSTWVAGVTQYLMGSQVDSIHGTAPWLGIYTALSRVLVIAVR